MMKTEIHHYRHAGDQTVRSAAQLVDKLPNGWRLTKLEYNHSEKVWVAVVTGPEYLVE